MGEIASMILAILVIGITMFTLIFSCVMMYLGWRDAKSFYRKFEEFVEEFIQK
jgi:uncharacterized membrane protein